MFVAIVIYEWTVATVIFLLPLTVTFLKTLVDPYMKNVDFININEGAYHSSIYNLDYKK